jgi:hypothetical protein
MIENATHSQELFMQFSWLVLPLLGGYIFITRFNGTRFIAERSDGQRFLFQNAIAGAFLLFVAAVLAKLCSSELAFVNTYWHSVVPYDNSGVTSLAFLLGCLLPNVGNLIWKIGPQADRAIILRGNAFELLFRRAMGTVRPVRVTMKNSEVYVGSITSFSGPLAEHRSISILPEMSEDDKDNIYRVATSYLPNIEGFRNAIEEALPALSKSEIALPMDEILSATFYDKSKVSTSS